MRGGATTDTDIRYLSIFEARLELVKALRIKFYERVFIVISVS